MTFDPTKYKEPDGGNWLQHSGTYIMAFTGFQKREWSRAGKEYVKFTVTVIAGSPSGQAGKRFSDRLFLTEAALGRLATLCKAMGWTKPFNPHSDKQIRHVMLNRPFKGAVKAKRGEQQVFCELGFPKPRESLSDDEYNVMDEWIQKRIDEGKMEPVEDDDMPLDDDVQEGGGGGGYDDDQPPPPRDEDEYGEGARSSRSRGSGGSRGSRRGGDNSGSGRGGMGDDDIPF